MSELYSLLEAFSHWDLFGDLSHWFQVLGVSSWGLALGNLDQFPRWSGGRRGWVEKHGGVTGRG
jgi:hypothetical protein